MPGKPGRSGRPRKPEALKRLAGNPGKRALNSDAPDFSAVTNIEAPEWLPDLAKQMWQQVCPELCAQKVLSITDLHHLELFCTAYAIFRDCEVHIKENGIVVEGATGGPVKNPALTAKNEAAKQMASHGGLLGLDPSSRQRLIGGGGGGKPTNRFNKFK